MALKNSMPSPVQLAIKTMYQPDILRGPERPEFIQDETLADLFEASVRRAPDQLALIHGERRISYADLNALADRAASRLLEAGIGPQQIVGLWLPRGIELLVMQLAIAKTGAAWLPFDADTPLDRIATCLADAQAKGMVSCRALLPHLTSINLPMWTDEMLLEHHDGLLRRRTGTSPDHPAYVIYTSGSTGLPKGIAISHRSICHFLRSENSVLGVRSEDRIYQGFSVAFDMSFEEIWIGYLAGATLWIAPKEVAVDLDSLPRVLSEQQITVLHAVPSSLALFSQDVPTLRLINLGGEMCPESLVASWTRPGRQVFNTYGPTEATVSASAIELRAGEPVTIGMPLPNYGLLVIAPDAETSLRLVPRGQVGELCITGPGVAAGYVGRPELSRQKFVDNPWRTDALDARLYRTGDLARIDDQGRVRCLGRVDDQVKIRGFRVELGEVEAVLCEQPGVTTAAALLRQEEGIDQLVAFMVLENGTALQPGALRAALAERLPSYMVPERYEALSEMPRLTSGKIDRNSLKFQPLTSTVHSVEGSDVAATEAEEALFAALQFLFPGQPIRRATDFFSDLGGHSLYAARLASTLRANPRFAGLTVRDIYLQRTVGQIAAVLESLQGRVAPASASWTPPSLFRRWRCGLAQAAVLPILIGMNMVQWLAPFFTYHMVTNQQGGTIPEAIGLAIGVFLLTIFSEFAIGIAGKWIIAGRLKPGRYPLWGWTYFRWWLADHLVANVPTYFLNGTSLYSWWLRALGARIGTDVQIGSLTLRAPDLLHIGDGASIGSAVNLENGRVVHGELLLGGIDIQANSYVGSCTVLEGNTEVGTWARLEGQSSLAEGSSVPPYQHWSGSPSRMLGTVNPAALPPRPAVTGFQHAGEGVCFIVGGLLIATLFFLPAFPAFILIDQLDELFRFAWWQQNILLQVSQYFLLAMPICGVLVVGTALLAASVRLMVLPKLRAGSSPVHSLLYCRKWLVQQILENSMHVLQAIFATLFAPFWFRLIGIKVGRNAEISSAFGVVPDMLTLGDDTFIADAVLLGEEEILNGWMTIQPTVVSPRSFIGNGAYVPDGTTIPENVLIGLLSQAPGSAAMKSGDTWLGSPPLLLPARELNLGYPESLTFRPSMARRCGRGLIEALRIVAPHALLIAVGYTVVLRVAPSISDGRWLEVLGDLVAAGLSFGLATLLLVALFKWLAVGRYVKRAEPMWTPFVWLSETATSLYENITVPHLLESLRGTPWLPLAMKLLGCRIARGVYMDTTDITEFDCVSIGAHSEINALVCPQTHLFEDRIMKIDHVQIGARVNIGPRSTVLFGARVEDDAQLGPLTLVMKGEAIPAATIWAGCPAAPVFGE